MSGINQTDLLQSFTAQFPQATQPKVIWAPGRVNLLGEHTDYNDGFVFPMAIDRGICMMGALNDSNVVTIYSQDFQTKNSFSLTSIQASQKQRWTNYIRGMCDQLQQAGYQPQGMDLILQGNIPQGAGLSSSAALEIATGLLISSLHNWSIDPIELVKLAQRTENEFVGVASGIMDQFASMMAQEDHALLLDCRSLDFELVPTPFEENNYAVVVIDSGVKRGLVDSEYNDRREQCEAAVQLLQESLPAISALRDVTISDLPLINKLPEVLAKRARHVVNENNRVLKGVEALKAGDLKSFGQLLNASHLSLKNDYQVSCPELDLLVELAQSIPGVLGTRMTGAGFGGCVVSLVPQVSVPLFKNKISQQYHAKSGLTAEIFIFKAAKGAHLIREEPQQF